MSDPDPPLLVRMLFDAFDEFERVADALPESARGAPIERLNSAGWIVAHVAQHQDRVWNVGLQDLEPDERLSETRAGVHDGPSQPDFLQALEAFRRARSRAIPYLRHVDEASLDEVVASSSVFRGEQSTNDLLVRSVAHLFSHAGELTAIASLAGAPDLGLPGRLTHSTHRT